MCSWLGWRTKGVLLSKRIMRPWAWPGWCFATKRRIQGHSGCHFWRISMCGSSLCPSLDNHIDYVSSFGYGYGWHSDICISGLQPYPDGYWLICQVAVFASHSMIAPPTLLGGICLLFNLRVHHISNAPERVLTYLYNTWLSVIGWTINRHEVIALLVIYRGSCNL